MSVARIIRGVEDESFLPWEHEGEHVLRERGVRVDGLERLLEGDAVGEDSFGDALEGRVGVDEDPGGGDEAAGVCDDGELPDVGVMRRVRRGIRLWVGAVRGAVEDLLGDIVDESGTIERGVELGDPGADGGGDEVAVVERELEPLRSCLELIPVEAHPGATRKEQGRAD